MRASKEIEIISFTFCTASIDDAWDLPRVERVEASIRGSESCARAFAVCKTPICDIGQIPLV